MQYPPVLVCIGAHRTPTMLRDVMLWLLGVPFVVIVLLHLVGLLS